MKIVSKSNSEFIQPNITVRCPGSSCTVYLVVSPKDLDLELFAQFSHSSWEYTAKCPSCGIKFIIPTEHVIMDTNNRHKVLGFLHVLDADSAYRDDRSHNDIYT
jgi:hypothetical protein